MSRRSTARRATPLAVVALLLGACGGPSSDLELSLRGVDITSPRLVTPAIELVPATPRPPALPEIPRITLPSAAPAAAAPVAPACAPADVFAVPRVPASVVVATPPAPGTFVQASDGGFVAAAGARGSLAGTVRTTITPATRTTSSSGQRVDTWHVVRTDAANRATWLEAYQLVHPGTDALAVAAGLWLVGLAWDDPARGTLVFRPAGNGLHVLPSPVQQAQNDVQYVGIATDPETLTTLQLTRNVRPRARVDACGALIDTFTVEIGGILTTRDAVRQVSWTQGWATAYGAIDVAQTFSVSNPIDGSTYERSVRNTAEPEDVT